MLNGDPETFSWWKTKMYSHIMGLDEELSDVLEDGVGDLVLNEEGVVVDRKKILLLTRSCTRSITRSEAFLLLLCLTKSI